MMENDAQDIKYMKEAIKLAKKAYKNGDVPIGCVIVYEDKIIGRGYNWRLEGCKLYVTLEPCQMCAGAILQARIPEVIMGCMNPKAGCAGSVINLLDMQGFNHRVKLTSGVMQEECTAMMKNFFKELREGKLGLD